MGHAKYQPKTQPAVFGQTFNSLIPDAFAGPDHMISWVLCGPRAERSPALVYNDAVNSTRVGHFRTALYESNRVGVKCSLETHQ